jgi:hypothetical protein
MLRAAPAGGLPGQALAVVDELLAARRRYETRHVAAPGSEPLTDFALRLGLPRAPLRALVAVRGEKCEPGEPLSRTLATFFCMRDTAERVYGVRSFVPGAVVVRALRARRAVCGASFTQGLSLAILFRCRGAPPPLLLPARRARGGGVPTCPSRRVGAGSAPEHTPHARGHTRALTSLRRRLVCSPQLNGRVLLLDHEARLKYGDRLSFLSPEVRRSGRAWRAVWHASPNPFSRMWWLHSAARRAAPQPRSGVTSAPHQLRHAARLQAPFNHDFVFEPCVVAPITIVFVSPAAAPVGARAKRGSQQQDEEDDGAAAAPEEPAPEAPPARAGGKRAKASASAVTAAAEAAPRPLWRAAAQRAAAAADAAPAAAGDAAAEESGGGSSDDDDSAAAAAAERRLKSLAALRLTLSDDNTAIPDAAITPHGTPQVRWLFRY